VHAVTEQAAKADDLIDEAITVGHGPSDPPVVHANMLRLELLNVKADLERELGELVLNCRRCGLDVHWVAGLGVKPATGRTASPRRTASRRCNSTAPCPRRRFANMGQLPLAPPPQMDAPPPSAPKNHGSRPVKWWRLHSAILAPHAI